MADFSHLLKKPAGQAKAPPALPAGVYKAVIKNWSVGDQNKNKTPYVRWELSMLEFPADVGEDERAGIDLTKRSQRCDYYITDDSVHRLDSFLRQLGVVNEGDDRTYEETLPECIGREVGAKVSQGMNESTNEVFSRVDQLLVMDF